MRFVVAALTSLIVAAPAHAADATSPERVGAAVAREVVHVAPGARDELSTRAAGRLRLRIVERAIGRIRIAVVPAPAVRRAGGLPAYANAVARAAPRPGCLLVTTGDAVWIVTSWADAAPAERAVRAAVDADPSAGLATVLRGAIDRLAAADPGDAQEPQPVAPEAIDDLVDGADGVFDALRLSLILVAAAVALPFLLGAGFLVRRARRQHVREEEALEAAWEDAQGRLVVLADVVTEADASSATASPEASRQLLDAYEQAGRFLDGPPRATSLERALRALDAGEQAGRVLTARPKAR